MKIFVISEFYYKDNLGGAEYQCHLICKYLARRGVKVYGICLKNIRHLQQEENVDGYTVVRLNDIADLDMLIRKHEPQICYIRSFYDLSVSMEIIQRFPLIKTVFHVSHVNDTCLFKTDKVNYQPWFHLPKRALCRWVHFVNYRALTKVDQIICLTEELARRLRSRHLNAIHVPNSVELAEFPSRQKPGDKVVWVANFKKQKRPEIFMQLARDFSGSHFEFVMSGAIQDARYKPLLESMSASKNFSYVGPTSFKASSELISQSAVLVHTCEPEGYGNVFIQAWICGVPTITLSFDPDGNIQKHRLGFHSRNYDQLKIDLQQLLDNKTMRIEMGQRAKEFALRQHDIEANILLFLQVFKGLLKS